MVRTENEIQVKQEAIEPSRKPKPKPDDSQPPACIINLFVLPVGFLDPLPGKEQVSRESEAALALPAPPRRNDVVVSGCKQFWKAGDYDGAPSGDWESTTAFAELLDNSLDEACIGPSSMISSMPRVCNGATYVNIDMVKSKKDGSKMLLIEDNGGGMDPDKMRQCMSLGYSVKSKMVDTIGQCK
ncbi:protein MICRORCHIDIA 7-like [Forsythia ovata]|uniref:Protein MICRORCHIDIA 7-like n=1 Tax=Forsythia ovata TaxID=205694 RepID=A0ABD1P6W5_9LAMI